MSYLEAAFGYMENFEMTCKCGAVLNVEVPRQKGHEESEEYWCPECMAEHRIRASNTPRVSVISSRTDEKN